MTEVISRNMPRGTGENHGNLLLIISVPVDILTKPLPPPGTGHEHYFYVRSLTR
jgi:hypothetical protein